MVKSVAGAITAVVIYFLLIAIFIGIGMGLDGFSFWEIILGLVIIAIMYFGFRAFFVFGGEVCKKIFGIKI